MKKLFIVLLSVMCMNLYGVPVNFYEKDPHAQIHDMGRMRTYTLDLPLHMSGKAIRSMLADRIGIEPKSFKVMITGSGQVLDDTMTVGDFLGLDLLVMIADMPTKRARVG